MILNNAINTNSFVYCSVYQSPNETTNYFNSGNGHFHESIYIIEGEISYAFADAQTLTGSETFSTLAKGPKKIDGAYQTTPLHCSLHKGLF